MNDLDLMKLLERGRKAKERLAPATDKLTETIAHIERALAEQHLGVEARVEMDRETIYDDAGALLGTSVDFVAFVRLKKSWRLVIESEIEGEGRDGCEQMPLINASRKLRLRSIDVMPLLISKLVEAAERAVAEVELKQAAAERILTSLRIATLEVMKP